MNIIQVKRGFIPNYIEQTLTNAQTKLSFVDEAYHHNTSYENAPLICQHGILSMNEQQKRGVKKYSSEILKTMSDTSSHVNGINDISLAKVGLTDLYHDEDEYNPYNPMYVDIIISHDVPTRRTSINYGNEYLALNEITLDKLKSIDIRLLKLIELYKNGKTEIKLEELVKKYNCLRELALTMKQFNLNIPLRDMYNNTDLDITKISQEPILILK